MKTNGVAHLKILCGTTSFIVVAWTLAYTPQYMLYKKPRPQHLERLVFGHEESLLDDGEVKK